MSNLFRYVGLRHLLLKPARSLLTTLGISFGIALFMAIQIINRSTIDSFKESVEAVAGKAGLTVQAGDAGFTEGKVDVIQKVDGVLHAAPLIESHAYFSSNEHRAETLVILGVDLLKEQGVRTYKTTDEEVMDDPLTFLNQPDSIILTHAFASSHGLKINSKFSLATARGMRTMTVRGLLTPEGPARAFGGALAIMDIDGARATFGKEGKVDRVDIVLKKDAEIGDVKKSLEKTLGPGYTVERPEGQSEYLERIIGSYQVLLSIFSMIALVVALFLVVNSVSIAVAERRREIGTLRAVGATRIGILSLFVSESIAMGLVGSVFGIGLGRLLASSMIDLVSRSISTQYLIPISTSHLVFQSSDVTSALLLGTVASFVASVWPAYRATKVQPLEAMKKTEIMSEDRHPMFTLKFFLGVGLLAYLSLSSMMLWGTKSHYLDLLNHFCAVAGVILTGPGAVTGLIMIFRPFVVRISGPVTRLAQDNLLRNPRRTGNNVMSLMIGLMLVIMISTMNVSFRDTIATWFRRALQADILVSSFGNLIDFQTQPLHEDVGRDLEKVPGVAVGNERGAYGVRFVHFNYGGRQIGIKAHDEPPQEIGYSNFDVQDRDPKIAGYELFHSPVPAVIVSENFVMHFNKRTGDTITLDTPSGPLTAKIVGVVVEFASPEGLLYLDRKLYKEYWGDPLVDAFAIYVKPGFRPEEVRSQIDAQFGKSKNLMTSSNVELRNAIIQSVDDGFAYTRSIEIAALTVALLGLLNTFLISVMERTREIGILRAAGMSRFQLSAMFLQEAVFQGWLGAVVAAGVGAWVAYLWISSSLSSTLGWIIHYSFAWHSIFATIGIGLLVTVAAGIYPAWRAAHLSIKEAIEYE